MEVDGLAIATAGGKRYALAQSAVRSIARGRVDGLPSLTTLLDLPSTSEERVVLTLHHAPSDVSVCVQQIDLRPSLPFLPMPSWLAMVVHPAVRGVVLDGDDLIPFLDSAPLVRDL